MASKKEKEMPIDSWYLESMFINVHNVSCIYVNIKTIWYYWILNSFVCKHWNLYLHSKLSPNRTQCALRPLQPTSTSKHEQKKKTFIGIHVPRTLYSSQSSSSMARFTRKINFFYHKLKSLTIIFKSCIVEMKCMEMKISFVQIVNLSGIIVERNTGKIFFHVVTLKRKWMNLIKNERIKSLFSWKSFNECGIRSRRIIAIRRNFRSCSFHKETCLRILSHFYCFCRTFWTGW